MTDSLQSVHDNFMKEKDSVQPNILDLHFYIESLNSDTLNSD